MKRSTGFTVIELMIAIAIVAILLAIGVPSFRSIIQNNRATTITNDLVSALQTARSEAVKRRAGVTVCRRNAGGTDCDNGTDWSVGWLVWQDIDGDGNVDADETIKVWDSPRGDPTVTGPNTGITFERTGQATAAGTFNVALPYCIGDEQRTIDVNAVGRVNSTRTACP